MISVGFVELHVLEAEFTNVKFWLFAILLGIRREIPRVDLVLSNLNFVNVLHLSDLQQDVKLSEKV